MRINMATTNVVGQVRDGEVLVRPLFDESVVEELIAAIDWERIPDGTMSNGKPYKTTKIQTFNITKDGFRYQFSGSCNRYPQPKDKALQPNLRGVERAVGKFELTPEQEQALDPEVLAAINTLKNKL